MNRLAVFLRGQLRTWNYTKSEMFEFFSGIADHVDYYIAVWDNTDLELLRRDFADKSVKAAITVSKDQYFNAWQGPAYMSHCLNSYRYNQEKINGIYDAIIDTRFDVRFSAHADPETVKPWTFGSTNLQGCYNSNDLNNLYDGLDDHCFLTTGGPHTIMNQRYQSDAGSDGNHISLYKYASIHGIECFKINWFTCKLVRPNCIDNHADPESHWQKLTQPERLVYIHRANIDPHEYSAEYHIGKLL